MVLETATGKQTQVGRQCLADFTGINSPQALAAKASWLSSFSDLREMSEGWFGAHFANTIDTLHVLSLTSAYIEACGWVPRSAMTGTATAGQVSEHFWGLPENKDRRAYIRQMEEKAQQPAHQERATKVIEWIKGELADKARSDYELNLVTLVSKDLMEQKHIGIVCSAASVRQRDLVLGRRRHCPRNPRATPASPRDDGRGRPPTDPRGVEDALRRGDESQT